MSNITARYSQFPISAWVRKCQECGNVQEDTQPLQGMTNAYQERKCKKCKSIGSLDYGMENWQSEDEDND